MKICLKCQEQLPFDNFGKHPKTKDGFKTRCRKCLAEDERISRNNNLEKRRARNREWNKNNPEKKRAMDKAYQEKNKEKIAKKRKEWVDNNYNKVKLLNHKRRVDKLSNGIYSVTHYELEKIRNMPCVYCGSNDDIQIDHIIPIARGGTHSIGNLTSACARCNNSKGKKTIMEWKIWKIRRGW